MTHRTRLSADSDALVKQADFKPRLRLAALVFCTAVLLILGQAVNAAPLNLTPSYPDLASGGTIDYDSGTGTFTLVDNNVMTLTPPPGTGFEFITDDVGSFGAASYSLVANFVGGVFQNGTVTVTGKAYSGNTDWISGTIVQADLSAFGFSGVGQAVVFEFGMANVTGDMAAFGSSGGIIAASFDLVDGSSNPIIGDWDPLDNNDPTYFLSDFSGTASSVDTFVPVPAAVWLFGSAILGLVGLARRKRVSN
jgi:hypothetical protein